MLAQILVGLVSCVAFFCIGYLVGKDLGRAEAIEEHDLCVDNINDYDIDCHYRNKDHRSGDI